MVPGGARRRILLDQIRKKTANLVPKKRKRAKKAAKKKIQTLRILKRNGKVML